jgi:hypothetical protein
VSGNLLPGLNLLNNGGNGGLLDGISGKNGIMGGLFGIGGVLERERMGVRNVKI